MADMPRWIQTDDGSFALFHEKFRETCHASSGAWTEALNVFLNPFLKKSPFAGRANWRVLDIGFGQGFNWLCYVNYFLHRCIPALLTTKNISAAQKNHLWIVSLEQDPAVLKTIIKPEFLGYYPIHDNAFEYLNQLRKNQCIQDRNISARLLVADYKKSLRMLAEENQKFQVILHNPFSPAAQPEVWDEEVFEMIAACCQKDSMLLTDIDTKKVIESVSHAGFRIQTEPHSGSNRGQVVAVY